MEVCNLCPRGCKAKRSLGKPGFCGQTDQVRVARAALHFWEEPCISGERGSGAVFFCGCPLKCVFCQNREIADRDRGKVISKEHLSEIFMNLQENGALNINLVTPTHFVPQIVDALCMAKNEGLTIPIVYNTSSYEKTETLKMLDGLIDIYLPDFKYMDCELAKRYSHATDYPKVAANAIEEMVRQVGRPAFNQEDILMRGVIVRHLILPGHTKDSMNVLDYLHSKYQDDILISIMNQFTPINLTDYPEINRKVTMREYEKVITYAIEIGIENGFFQEGKTQLESFIPEFDNSGV